MASPRAPRTSLLSRCFPPSSKARLMAPVSWPLWDDVFYHVFQLEMSSSFSFKCLFFGWNTKVHLYGNVNDFRFLISDLTLKSCFVCGRRSEWVNTNVSFDVQRTVISWRWTSEEPTSEFCWWRSAPGRNGRWRWTTRSTPSPLRSCRAPGKRWTSHDPALQAPPMPHPAHAPPTPKPAKEQGQFR